MSLKPKLVSHMGMTLDEWKYASCTAHFGCGDDWATLYDIRSLEPGKGHATYLLRQAKAHYEERGMVVGGSVALTKRMERLYQHVGIREYTGDDL